MALRVARDPTIRARMAKSRVTEAADRRWRL